MSTFRPAPSTPPASPCRARPEAGPSPAPLVEIRRLQSPIRPGVAIDATRHREADLLPRQVDGVHDRRVQRHLDPLLPGAVVRREILAILRSGLRRERLARV